MKITVYNQQGKETGEVDLPKDIFEVPLNADLVHQVMVSQMGNARQISAHTKIRSEVRGGGKKPWRQKGTGRARHGSIRSPLWRGGGITFGPRKDKVYETTIPKKMRRKALYMVLSEKAKNNMIVVLEDLVMASPRTKEMASSIKKLPCANHSMLMALPQQDKNVMLSSRNIAKMDIEEARNLNVLSLLNHQYLILTKESIKTIEETFTK